VHVPEYSITTETLNNISNIEYGRAVIESMKILSHWEKKLKKDALIRTVESSLVAEGFNFEKDLIKRYVEGQNVKVGVEVKNIIKALELADHVVETEELEEDSIKNLYSALILNTVEGGYKGGYRSVKIKGIVAPEEILASIVGLVDWYNTLDAKQSHPVVVSAVMAAGIEKIFPFESFNGVVAGLVAKICMKIRDYGFKDFISLEEQFGLNRREYRNAVENIRLDEDLTAWLEFFTDVLSREVINIKDKVMLLAKDTKIAKVTGRADLSERQEYIVEFLQDYGILQNKDFGKAFPNISEDTVLRDLKVLMYKGIVAKRGKTKSSRYELK